MEHHQDNSWAHINVSGKQISLYPFALKQNVFTNALVNMEDSGVNHDDAHPLTKILCHADPLRSCVMLTH